MLTTQPTAHLLDALHPGADGWRRAAHRSLYRAGTPIGSDVLAAIAAGLAVVTVPWELRGGEIPLERQYERVLSTPAYDAWVICWPSGGSLDLHDHGGSGGAVHVVAGQLEEAVVERGITTVRRLTRGDTASFGPTRVHAIANTSAATATSVHVYSPPLASMVYYERSTEGGLVAVSEDSGGWDLPVLQHS